MAIKEIQWPSSSSHLFNTHAYSFGVVKDFKKHVHLSAQEQFDGLRPSSSCSLGMVLLSTLEAMKWNEIDFEVQEAQLRLMGLEVHQE